MNKCMDKNLIGGISIIKTSGYRRKILDSLSKRDFLTPSEISKITSIRLNHISNFLRDLVENNLATCLNNNQKRGRLYQITALGKSVMEKI